MLFSKHEILMSPPPVPLRQKTYRDQCFVTQAIQVALARRCQGGHPSDKGAPGAVRASVMKVHKGAIVGCPQDRRWLMDRNFK